MRDAKYKVGQTVKSVGGRYTGSITDVVRRSYLMGTHYYYIVKTGECLNMMDDGRRIFNEYALEAK